MGPLFPGPADAPDPKKMKETTRDEGGLRAALDTCKFVWLTGVVLWHAAGCGSAPSCFGDDAASLGAAAYVPQLLGVVMLSGLMLASGVKDAIRTVSVRSAVQPALVALAYQLVDLLLIRPVLLGGAATIATAGHVWFLYSLSMARFLGMALSPKKLLMITLVLNFITAYVWRFMDDDVFRFDERPPAGLAASPAEWFDAFGVRCLTWTWFYAVGKVLTPPSSIMRWRTHLTMKGRLFNWAITLATMAYSATRLTLNPSTHFFAHGWAFDDWPSLLMRHVELLVLATIGPVACLLVAPCSPSFLSECGGHTLLVYLAHPVALKMLVRPATRVIVGSSLTTPARAVIALGAPLALQCALHLASILCWRDKQRRRRLPRLLALAAAVAICVEINP